MNSAVTPAISADKQPHQRQPREHRAAEARKGSSPARSTAAAARSPRQRPGFRLRPACSAPVPAVPVRQRWRSCGSAAARAPAGISSAISASISDGENVFFAGGGQRSRRGQVLHVGEVAGFVGDLEGGRDQRPAHRVQARHRDANPRLPAGCSRRSPPAGAKTAVTPLVPSQTGAAWPVRSG